MAYIPQTVVEDTQFPTVGAAASAPDLTVQIQMIREEWERSFPLVDYYSLLTTPTETEIGKTSGGPLDTQADPLWGEDVAVADGANWVQPHGQGSVGQAVDAVNARKYADAVTLNARVQLNPTDRTLKKIGLDQSKGILLTIPTPTLDTAGIESKPGDRFRWRGELFELFEVKPAGYWFNTTVFLFINAMCERRIHGT